MKPSTQIHDRIQATTIQQAHKYMTAHRPQRFNKNTNTWPLTGHNDSTSPQIHDRSQATTIQQAHKYMTAHTPQRFNKHTNTWPITGHSDSTSTQIHDRSQATTIQQAHKNMTAHRPQYGITIWCLWPNIRFLPSRVTEKNAMKNILDGQKDGQR